MRYPRDKIESLRVVIGLNRIIIKREKSNIIKSTNMTPLLLKKAIKMRFRDPLKLIWTTILRNLRDSTTLHSMVPGSKTMKR